MQVQLPHYRFRQPGWGLHLLVVALLTGVLLSGAPLAKEGRTMAALTISSSVFVHKGAIPAPYTCDGRDAAPPLTIAGVPAGSRSLAIIMDDPDAPGGTWVHWVAWNILPQTRQIADGALPSGSVQGMNSWKRGGYGGPCPPSGTHRYVFKVYALDIALNVPPVSTKASLEAAMQGHILAQGELVGTYRRR